MLLGLLGIVAGLGLLIWLSYRGWSVLLLAPAAAIVAAAAAGEPLLAHWTETFMGGAAKFLAQFFPLFLLGALFGKLMDDSGSVETIARFMTEKLDRAGDPCGHSRRRHRHRYGGVSLFVAFFVLVPMAQSLFKAADIPRRLAPASIALGTMTFTMSALPYSRPGNADPDAVLRHHTLRSARPRHYCRRHHARLRAAGGSASPKARARRVGEGYGTHEPVDAKAEEQSARERATIASGNSIPPSITHGRHAESTPSVLWRSWAADRLITVDSP